MSRAGPLAAPAQEHLPKPFPPHKREAKLPVYEPQREQAVFDRVRAANPGPLGDAELLHVYERIIDVMRSLQRRDV